MSPRSPKRIPDDSTRPADVSKAEWGLLCLHLKLAPRECEALGLAIQGWTNKEIGTKLRIDWLTARNYVDSCEAKLRAKRRTALGYKALVLLRRLTGH